MNKYVRITLISLPILVLGGIAYWQIKKYKVPAKQPAPNTNGLNPVKSNVTNTPAPAISNSGCTFPLKKGSINPCVGQLQIALGQLVVDNNFGSKTLARLQAVTGKSQVDSSVDLANILSALKDSAVSDFDITLSKSNALISQYQNNPIKWIQSLASTSWQEVKQDGNNNWVPAGYILNASNGLKFSTADYSIMQMADEDTGFVVIYCNKGNNMGYWLVNPDEIKLL